MKYVSPDEVYEKIDKMDKMCKFMAHSLDIESAEAFYLCASLMVSIALDESMSQDEFNRLLINLSRQFEKITDHKNKEI